MVYVLVLFIAMLFSVLLFLNEDSVYSLFSSSTPTLQLKQSQNTTSSPLSKPKYIWLMLDAFASFQSGDLHNFSVHSSYYHIKNTGYPQSAAIASEQVLGRSSRNYVGEYISEETIFEQINSFPTDIMANTFPLLSILGYKRFKSVTKLKGREAYPLSRIKHSAIFDPDYITMKVCQDFAEAKREVALVSNNLIEFSNFNGFLDLLNRVTINQKRNFVYYTSIMDSFNHNYAGLDVKTLAGAAALLADIKSLCRAIEMSQFKDEYVFIVTSDHGGQVYMGEDEVCNHGCLMDKGNEGFMFIYSYGTQHFEDWITNEDVSAIITEYITDANIPVHSTGWPRPLRDEKEFWWRCYRRKEQQLLAQLNRTITGNYENIEEYLIYLQKLQKEANQRNSNTVLLIFLMALLCLVSYQSYRLVNKISLFLLFEHIFIFLQLGPLMRIENLLYTPVILLNSLCFANELYQYSWSKFRSNSLSFSVFSHKLKDFLLNQTKLIVISINLLGLLTRSERINPIQQYAYYYIHYIMLFLYLYLYTSFLSVLSRFLTMAYIAFILGLALYYEQITDYSMTDQTDEMMDTVHLFYGLLLAFIVFVFLLPRNANKKRLICFPLVILYFFIASQAQRSYLIVIYLPALYVLSQKDEAYMILILALSSYLTMLGTYGFDISLRAGNHSWGVNPDQFPVFTGFLFGVHKLSWFMLAGCGILASKKFEEMVVPLVLRALAAILLFLYVFYAYPSSALSAFMWCMSQCLTLILSHSLGLASLGCRRKRLKNKMIEV